MVFRRSPVDRQRRQESVLRRAGIRGATALVMLAGTVGLTAFLATNPAAAAGTARYVAQGGSNTSNDCTSAANPCATISHAENVASSGDRINVSGTIDDHVTVGKSLTITQWPFQPQAVVDGTGSGVPFTINSGTVTFHRLIIQHGFNTSNPALGGGIYDNGALTLNNTTVANNTTTSPGFGGGIYIAGGGPGLHGTLTLNDSTVSNNTAGTGAGGITNSDGEPLTVNNSTIRDNVGAMGIDNSGTLTVDNSTISGNTGAGIVNEQNVGHATVTDSTIANNSSNHGPGGIFEQGGTATFTLRASTVSGNVSVSTAGGIENTGSISVGATIVAGNTPGGNCSGNASTSLGYNLTDDSTGTACGFTQPTDVVNANPNLGSLANNGGPTQTKLPQPPSPAIRAVPNPTTLSGGFQVCPRKDQRGVSSTPGTMCTIGAVEVPSIRYVAQGGSDTSNDCSLRASPCATISHAVSVIGSTSGDTINVSGTIDDHVTIATSLTITQWRNHGQAIVDGTHNGVPFTISSGTITMNKLTIQHGSNASGNGGGINNDGNLTLTDSTIAGNTANNFGGGIANGGNGNLTLTDSTISGNTASTNAGGGISNGNFATITASTISGNTAAFGGGIDNEADTDVGATIVSTNSPTNCSGPSLSSFGYNLSDDSSGTACGFTQPTDIVNANPELGSLANNGGPTKTMLPTSTSAPENFVIPNPTMLSDGSQVCPRTDQRGAPSLPNFDCTIGAVEAVRGIAPRLPSGASHIWTTGKADSFTVTATGYPPPAVTHPSGQAGAGTIPNGLTLSVTPGANVNATNATFSGKPAANAGGTYDVKLVAENGVSPASTQIVTLVIQQAPIMALPKNGGTVGVKAGAASSVPWSVSSPATTWPHITQPVSYTTNGFPAGLNFNNNGNGTGTISGTLAKGTYGPMSIKASNVAGSSTTTFFIKAS